jgi:hypothetical protein
VAVAAVLLLCTLTARAETWEAPVGGSAIALGDARIACPGTTGDWTIEQEGHAVRPPSRDDSAGGAVDARVAPSLAACEARASALTLIATGRAPQIDAATLYVDEARLELVGRALRGVQVEWRAADRAGDDRCVLPQVEGGAERCAVSVGHGLRADPAADALHWLPAGARAGPDVVLFDASGRRSSEDQRVLIPSRVVVSSLVSRDVSLDLAGGTASRIPLVHPEAVTDADCGAVSCDVSGGAIVVGGLTTVSSALAVHLHLAPRVFLRRGDALDSAPVVTVPVLPCAMSVASGEALRGVDATRAVVRVDARCAADAHELRWFSAGRALDVLGTSEADGAAYILLAVGRVEGDDLVITAVRGGADGSTVGQAHVRARAAPLPRATLTLDDGETIDFVPTNRSAAVQWARSQGIGELALVGVDGVYDVSVRRGSAEVQGEHGAGGFVALRFAWRVPSLPGTLAATDLAVIADPVQRPMHEAPVAVALTAAGKRPPFVEVVCAIGADLTRIAPGADAHVPFAARDACRVIVHPERLSGADGTQHLQLDVDVTGVDGTTRPDAHASESVVVRPGGPDRVIWIKGVVGSFDRATIHVAHVGDTGSRDGVEPGAQYAIVFGTAHFRLYATTAIPTGLYRVSDRAHSGILSLNLAVVMRSTWLDRDGHEGVLGVEGGVLAEGLANDVDTSGHSLTQVAAVVGLGLSVPIANRSLATETSINLHAWFEYEVSRALNSAHELGSPFGFVFGPSISIGNVGTNL